MSLPLRVPASANQAVQSERKTVGPRVWREVMGRSVARILRPLTDRRLERAWQRDLPDFAMRISRTLRAGSSIDRALVEVMAEGKVPPRIRGVAVRVQGGQPMVEVIERWSHDARSDPEALLVAALGIALRSGAQLGPVVDGLGVALRDELALDARRRVLLVQAQMSAMVLVLMPLAFVLFSSLLRGSFAFSGNVGLVLLVSGVLLDGLGVLWMRRLLRRLR